MKRLQNRNTSLDTLDTQILRVLTDDARTSMAELARAVGLSAPSVTERVRRLEEAGVVRGYAADVDPRALGLALSAYIRIRPVPGQLKRVAGILVGLEAIVECDRVTGDDCFIAKAHVGSVGELEALIDKIMPYAMTNTAVIQSTPVKRRLPPFPDFGRR